MQDTYFAYNTPIGHVTIASNGRALTGIVYGTAALSGDSRPTALTNDAVNQLQEYFAGRRRVFRVALEPSGSDFQEQVWDALQNIPYGQTRTYAELACAIGRPNSARAVGAANNANPLAIVIPSHRVLRADGTPAGDAQTVRIKEFLLNLEQTHR